MSLTIADRKSNLSAMLHGGTLNKVRNIEMMFERSANTMLTKIDPIETIRVAALSQPIYDDEYNYPLPSDYKKLIDLYPQDNRNSFDTATRRFIENFDLKKAFASKQISIEGSEGSKTLRVNWRSRKGKLFNAMDSLTANGTWSAVGTAANLAADSIFKTTGAASIRFDVLASGDGIQNTTMTKVDFTTENQIADEFMSVFLGSDYANCTAINFIFGNDLTTKYYTCVAQTTQADGTAFRNGWNIIRSPWGTATQTGTVDPTTVDSAKITLTTTGALSKVRIDNLVFTIGRNFDTKYYSKYLLKNSAGAWISRTTSDLDTVVLDNDAIQILLMEDLIAAAQQMEGSDSAFDIAFAEKALYGNANSPDPLMRMGLYAKYRKENPNQSKKAIDTYGSYPGRGRWGSGSRYTRTGL